MMMRAILFTVVLSLVMPLAGSAADTIRSDDLDGFVPLSDSERKRIVKMVEGLTIAYELREADIGWQIHTGDLVVPGNLINEHALIIDGNLEIQGLYDDYASAYGGLLIVLGDLAAEHVFTWYGFYVAGSLTSPGILYGEYNDYATEVGKGVDARAVVMSDHSSDLGTVRAEVELYEGWDEELEQAVALLAPDLFANLADLELGDSLDSYALYPDYEAAKALAFAGKPLFRAERAGPQVLDAVRVAVAEESARAQLGAIIGLDPLVDRIVAARPDLGKKLAKQLLASRDDAVRSLSAPHATSMEQLGGASRLTVEMAERLVENPETPVAMLAGIADADDPAVRKTLAFRDDLPISLIARLAADGDPEVRARVLRYGDNADRLPVAELARLAQDSDEEIRSAVARANLPRAVATTLATDESRTVRLALAEALAYRIDDPNPRMTEAERSALAATLGAGDEDVLPEVFPALSSTQQVRLFEEQMQSLEGAGEGARRFDWQAIAEQTRSVELMRAMLARADDLDLQDGLASNLALPAALQIVIVERASRPGKTCESCWSAETPDEVLTTLLINDNVAPAALLAAAKIINARGNETLLNELTSAYHIPVAGLELLDGKWGGGEDWSLSVILQPQATRAMLERALPRWYDDAALRKAIARMRKLGGDAWWRALATSKHDDLRETAARNVHTPPELLRTLLDDPVWDVWAGVCRNRGLPAADLDSLARRDLACQLSHPATTLAQLADFARSAPTRNLREHARKLHAIRLRRAW